MKIDLRLYLVITLFVSGARCAFGVSVVLDSFSEGTFYLESGGDETHETGILSPLLLDTRSTYAKGNGKWSVILASGTGVIDYNVDTVLSAIRFGLVLDYTRASGGHWSLLGYDALVFEFTDVTGEGLLEIFVNDQDSGAMVRRSVTTPGLLVYPLEDLAASNLGSISGMSISFTPQTDTFSMSLNQITVVPEPSLPLLLLTVAVLIGGRRARRLQS
jgi:hypothetical protein